MQGLEELRSLIAAVRGEMQSVGARAPLLVKIGPDLVDSEVKAIADLAVEVGLDGIVAVNTTSDAGVLTHSSDEARSIGHGGISGAPLKRRSVEVLRVLHARAGDRLVLISVGGIETADDVWERIAAGAALVQAYTGFVYGGPAWASRINRELARRLKAAGLSSVEELSGTKSSAVAADQRASAD
jgi:dihydroorotate dehydrogenase